MKEKNGLEPFEISKAEFDAVSRRSLLKAAFAAVAGSGAIAAVFRMEQDRGMPWLLRRATEINDSVWKSMFDPNARAAAVSADGLPVRVNGDAGLLPEVDEKAYRLAILDPGRDEPLEMSLAQIQAMPSVSGSFEFKCIEGWARPVSCRGVRFADLLAAIQPSEDFAYVGMASINKGYYVSWDMKSLLHPQTMLCWEMNGRPLTPDNGAPLRLLSPIKYGVKQIKQIGTIAFAQSPPADYWAEQGYGEYLGL